MARSRIPDITGLAQSRTVLRGEKLGSKVNYRGIPPSTVSEQSESKTRPNLAWRSFVLPTPHLPPARYLAACCGSFV